MSESPSVYTETRPKARKDHRCCECGGVIHKSETYHRFDGIWCGKGDSFATCSDCDKLREDVKTLTPYADEWPAFRDLGNQCMEYDGDYWERFEEIRKRHTQPTNNKTRG